MSGPVGPDPLAEIVASLVDRIDAQERETGVLRRAVDGHEERLDTILDLSEHLDRITDEFQRQLAVLHDWLADVAAGVS